jgi:hypothetical protein
MGDPSAQLALYFSAVNAGGRYTTAIGTPTSLFARAYTGDVIRRMRPRPQSPDVRRFLRGPMEALILLRVGRP